MAKLTPAKFVNQVRDESRKIVWPTWAETVRISIMVLIMTTILALFFLAVDSTFSWVVSALLSLAQ